MIGDRTRATRSRGKEFFQGFFLPSLLGILGFLPDPLIDNWQRAHDNALGSFHIEHFATAVGLVGSLGLIALWWRRARWRAYGVIAGMFAAPFLVFGLFLLVITVFQLRLYP